MRLSGLGALTMGMLLLNRGEAWVEEDATTHFSDAINFGCAPWILGGNRDEIGAKLRRDGWETIDDAEFKTSGAWGAVDVLLRTRETRRACEIRMRSDEEPWTTVPAATAVQAWIAGAFPGAVRERAASMVIVSQLVRVSLWSDRGVKITLTTYETKQKAPNADFILRVECI
jgi:hypothetical protein